MRSRTPNSRENLSSQIEICPEPRGKIQSLFEGVSQSIVKGRALYSDRTTLTYVGNTTFTDQGL